MFLSPGHSPRQISSPTQSSYSDDGFRSTLRSSSSKIIPRYSRKRMRVLDEDTYVEAIEKIIERDYFPDIAKLRDRLDWIQAVKTRDPIQIRDAQLKIIERRGKKTKHHHLGDTEGKTQTPGSTFLRNFTPLDEFDGKSPGELLDSQVNTDDGDGDIDVNLSLDEFFRRYTSEDNDSFSKILEKVNRKKKEKFCYLLKEDAKLITDGYGTSDQPPSTLQGWKYTAKNLLMYHPADCGEAPLTVEERAVRLLGLTKEIVKANTRFHGKTMDYKPREDGSGEILYTPIAGSSPMRRDRDNSKRYDLDDLRKTPNPFYIESNKRSDNGYSFVRTPSPAPGLEESPFITWGEIEGTPMRLDPIDIDGNVNGPHYNIPLAPARDVRAHSLSNIASRKLRERFKKPPLPSSPNVRTLSPAAQKFFRRAIAKSSSTVDESLRASYRGASPGGLTPKSRSVSRFSKDRTISDSRSP